MHTLQSTREYMVGRSRRLTFASGIRRRCRTFHRSTVASFTPSAGLRRPDGWQPLGRFRARPSRGPSVRAAWIEDLSQNGTFINGNLIGKGKSQALNEGDRIEMVFPSNRQPQQQQANQFPIFTYVPVAPTAASAPRTPPVDEADFFRARRRMRRHLSMTRQGRTTKQGRTTRQGRNDRRGRTIRRELTSKVVAG